MLKEQIVVGKAYVNERARILREVVEEIDERHVKFNAFDLRSWRLLPSRHRTCEKREIASWAEREARPDETARAHPFQPDGLWTQSDPDGLTRAMKLEEAKSALETTASPHAFPQAK